MTTEAHSTAPGTTSATIGRRGMLRGGALFAGAAAGVALAAATAEPAAAADGDTLLIGEANTAESATTLALGGDQGSTEPTLALENADGPSLRLQTLSHVWAGSLQVGEIAGTELGPIVGVETSDGPATTYLVTGIDLANLPSPFPMTPTRILDLRSAASRQNAIVRRSATNALAADGKLRAGQWIDVALATTGADASLEAVFAQLTALVPTRAGWGVLHPPGVRPALVTVALIAGQNTTSGTFVGTGEAANHHVVRLYTSVDAWYVIDVTGGVTRGNVATPLAKAARTAGGRAALASKMRKAIAQTAR